MNEMLRPNISRGSFGGATEAFWAEEKAFSCPPMLSGCVLKIFSPPPPRKNFSIFAHFARGRGPRPSRPRPGRPWPGPGSDRPGRPAGQARAGPRPAGPGPDRPGPFSKIFKIPEEIFFAQQFLGNRFVKFPSHEEEILPKNFSQRIWGTKRCAIIRGHFFKFVKISIPGYLIFNLKLPNN